MRILSRYRRVALAVLAFSALAVLLSCKKQTQSPLLPPVGVSVSEVIQRDVTDYSDWVGTTEGFVDAEIYPKVSGYVVKQDYRDGDVVHAGEVLFEIDSREYRAALEQAQGNLAKAEAQLKENQLNLDRYTDLIQQQVISRQEFDNQNQTTLASSAQVQAYQAAVQTARLNLEWTRVISPVNGVASIAAAQVGYLVSPTTLLTTVSQLDPIKVEFQASEQMYLRVADRINQDPVKRAASAPRFQMILSDGRTYKYDGQVYAVNRQVDIQTGTIKVQATFPNPNNVLRPGLYAKVRASTGVLHNALLIPQSALLQTQGQYQVAVVDSGNKVTMRNVDIGQQSGSMQVIKSGLSAGERVVADGVQKVHDGSMVNPSVVPTPAALDRTLGADKTPAGAPTSSTEG